MERFARGGCSKAWKAVIAVAVWAVVVGCPASAGQSPPEKRVAKEEIRLPPPQRKSTVSLEEALAKRRSARRFRQEPLALAQVGQLAWAAQGVTEPVKKLRTAPSAGATYPLEVYLLTPDGHFRYLPITHRLERLGRQDLRSQLAEAAVDQKWIGEAPLTVVIAAVFERTSTKYGDRALRYVHLEAGHAAQNMLLQATALGLGGTCVGAFYEAQVQGVLGVSADQIPLYVIAIGRPL